MELLVAIILSELLVAIVVLALIGFQGGRFGADSGPGLASQDRALTALDVRWTDLGDGERPALGEGSADGVCGGAHGRGAGDSSAAWSSAVEWGQEPG